MVRAAGLAFSVGFAVLIVWLYASQPQTGAEAFGGLASTVGAYRVNSQAFDEALAFFNRDMFPEARMAFARADPARRDPRTQFYIAYSFYRQGWGRVYNDDALFRGGLAAAERAITLSPEGALSVDDPELKIHTAAELKAELERGLVTTAEDLNPFRVFRERK